MSKFSKGEIAILINADHAFLIGREVMLIKYRWSEVYKTQMWEVEIPGEPSEKYGASCWVAHERDLRKRPQQDDNLFTEWAKSHLITDLITDIRPTETQVRIGG